GKIAEDFFKAFEARLQARFAPPVPAGAAAPASVVTRPPQPAGTLGWALAGIVIVVTAYFVLR
ncbi:MAG: hypothetical protein ABIV63_17240, partial [Caldimonas sp.]